MATAAKTLGFIPRPTAQRGFWSWVATVDHKRIGIMYGVTGFFFFLVGGLEAWIMRLQLARPGLEVVTARTFNALFTMHATTMIFLGVMPLLSAFMNYFLPLMIGARDVAFPRLNAFSYWIYLFGALFINAGWLMGTAGGHVPDIGWFGYANLTSVQFTSGLGPDFWTLGLLLLGIGTLVSGFNFIVTILNMRAPGMTLMKMPVFVWTTLVTSAIIIFAFPSVTVALIMLMFDRTFAANFFEVLRGGSVVFYQHLFWTFGHPEVYILILPAMGIISEVIPVHARKMLFGYSVMVFSTALIGFMGFTVWSHHMFTVGMGPVVNSIFSLTTMAIAVPTGVKIFNWLSTMWGGQIRFTAAMLFAIGFIASFTIGGLSGFMHAAAPSDAQQHDTYFVVAHIHYVLIGGSIFAILSGIHHWFPKVFGRMLDERLGRWSFALIFTGFHTFAFPFHILGLLGMPRRIYTYAPGLGWENWNLLSTIGVFILAAGVLVLIANFIVTMRKPMDAPADPWDGRTLEWTLPSPPPAYNFARVPVVHLRDAFWFHKHPEGNERALEYESPQPAPIHLPGPSLMPILLALGPTVAAVGMLFLRMREAYAVPVIVAGFVITLLALWGWAFEGEGGTLVEPEGAD
ncbi:cytochrome c oxidase subunit I [Symbiobacterium thermophilum]|uniref:Cytochrome c oxidase subunit 1 n=1 Tax=Symbiobacterium thermophilum TaxID=2734 RepID=A0A953I9Q4_SYMTR|nr:cytochrome c oxidase subunit I [Symbiobacterium thermophilum]MBY6275334.1 cytochrome c oxidase subunit I [Symbiobacterium thermophilum]